VGQDDHMKSYTSEQGGCQEGSQGTQKGIPDFKEIGFAFCKPIIYFRVEAHFNRSKITLHLESTLKSTPSKLNGFWQRPPKAVTPPLSLFVEGLHFGAPNKGTNNGESATDGTALYGPIGSSSAKIWVHSGCCHGERGPKPLKGRAVAAHVGCCVLWLCFVLWLAIEY